MSGVNFPGVKSTPPCRILLIRGIEKSGRGRPGRGVVLEIRTHPDKGRGWFENPRFWRTSSKVVTNKHRPSTLVMLPFVAYHYHLRENLLYDADSEKDLGVHANKSFNFNEQCEILLTKANKKFVILSHVKIGEEFFIFP